MEQQQSQELFYNFLEQEMRKIEQFTKKQVEEVRRQLAEAERKINLALAGITARSESEVVTLRLQVEKAGEDFLKLEKFVNLNFMGFHKILKKHDKRLPNPCKAFYTARLHEQSWVRGDYSDVLVNMSRVYSKLRGDREVEEKENAKQVGYLVFFYSRQVVFLSLFSSGFRSLDTQILGAYRRYFSD